MIQRIKSLALGALLAGAALSASAAETVVFGTVTRITLGYAPLVAAMELGYFKQEDIDLQIREFVGTAVLMPQIATKQVTIGYPAADTLILTRQPGKDPLPARFFYNAIRSSIWEFYVPENSPIKSIKDLKGKKIGIAALANGNVPITRALFKEMGLVEGKDFEFQTIGVGAPAYNALTTGQVDVYNTFDVNAAQMLASGIKVRKLEIPAKYQQLMSNGYVTHEDNVRNNPKMLAGFGRAATKGVIACDENPRWCVSTFWKHYPQSKPQQGTEEEKMAAALQMLGARQRGNLDFSDVGNQRKFGLYSPDVWKRYVQVLHDGGQLSTTNIDTSTLYTNALVDEFNKFDEAKVRAESRQQRAMP
ncbi:ABC transporter substrate-binding protein [Ramlibacter sp.]|uniref:ABC transporter substrate-binding protein n=1 Tax=Ramlibacter sp. TaxID=1917967 RepID=UPI002FCBBBD8